jgi:hypothetical protein
MVKILPSCLIRGNNLVSVDIEEYPNLKMKKIIKKGQLVSYIIEATFYYLKILLRRIKCCFKN